MLFRVFIHSFYRTDSCICIFTNNTFGGYSKKIVVAQMPLNSRFYDSELNQAILFKIYIKQNLY